MARVKFTARAFTREELRRIRQHHQDSSNLAAPSSRSSTPAVPRPRRTASRLQRILGITPSTYRHRRYNRRQ